MSWRGEPTVLVEGKVWHTTQTAMMSAETYHRIMARLKAAEARVAELEQWIKDTRLEGSE
jgi:hypothetical protein